MRFRFFLAVLCIAMCNVAHAQKIPNVDHIPFDVRPIRIREFSTYDPSIALVVDGIMVVTGTDSIPARADSLFSQAFNSVPPDSIADISVIKGPRAVALGACTGVLIVIRTNAGNWRPQSPAPKRPSCSKDASATP